MKLGKVEGQMLVDIVTGGSTGASRDHAIKQLEKYSPTTIIKLKKQGHI